MIRTCHVVDVVELLLSSHYTVRSTFYPTTTQPVSAMYWVCPKRDTWNMCDPWSQTTTLLTRTSTTYETKRT